MPNEKDLTTMKMGTGVSSGIFHDINNPRFTEDEKAFAIYQTLGTISTYRQAKKAAVADVARYLFKKLYGYQIPEVDHGSE